MVRWVYEEDYPADIAERMLEHEPLHLAIVLPTPMRPSEKGPADLDLIGRLIIGAKARRSYHLTGRGFHRKQRSPGVQRLPEEGVEASGLGATLVRMLLPDQWVGSNREELIVIGWGQRAKGHQRTFQNRLRIKGHSRLELPWWNDRREPSNEG
jgi:hypothetical protein